jgi:hypothetical protein
MMTLKPIPGAPDGAPIPDFPMDKPITAMTPAERAAMVTPTAAMREALQPARRHWTARTDQVGAVHLASRRGYGTKTLIIRLFSDHALVIDDVELVPAAADRLIAMWHSGSGEFEYAASATVTVHARWTKFDDGKAGFGLHVFDELQNSLDKLNGVTASEREAMKTIRKLLVLRGKP